MLKKRIYLFCALAGMFFGTLGNVFVAGGTSTNEKFTDVKADDWFYDYVYYLTENDIIKGMTESTFEPDGNFTYAQSFVVITRYLGLENEAGKRKEAMEMLGVKGAELWYSGYVKILTDAGIIDPLDYGCETYGRVVSINDTSVLDSPITRCAFADLITKSFDFDNSLYGFETDVCAKDFIIDGEYDKDKVNAYISAIKDYGTIPEKYRGNVLKSYYNGIFNGDENGNFNPISNLRRSEMAKVLAVIMNKDMRKFAEATAGSISFTDINDNVNVSEIRDFLKSQAANMTVSGGKFEYVKTNSVPENYKFELRIYRRNNFGESVNVNSFAETFDYDCSPGDVVLMTVRNTARDKIIGAYSVTVDSSGLKHNDYRYLH